MAEENAQGATTTTTTTAAEEAPVDLKVAAPKRIVRNNLWWAILVVYLFLFVTTGFLAFIERDTNPILKQGVGGLTQQLNDEATKTFMLNTLEEEAEEHKKKDGLVLQSFNIVLGSLLGFLSASATMSVPGKDDA